LRANNGFVSEILTQPFLNTRANYLFDKVGKMLRHFWSGHMLTGLPCVPRFTPAAQHQPASMLQPIDDARSFSATIMIRQSAPVEKVYISGAGTAWRARRALFKRQKSCWHEYC
jgi:hypothetical protein